ncbi:MAG: putative toxin-antitoxin system toxin component, PIN family [Chromatiales bacterium]|jgi:putative PIN family toxin of toxin-antitoxin system|nr:putative toxin-antitoxin system toxin component, PIN family [Chromatiales bacterium]MDX9766313.1 putative toxin-antitoxin system toxin component, PIN family [Ectothiorhodospiraceae bacterium]
MGKTGLRVVCDTNVVVSALLFPTDRLVWLRDAWREGRIVPLVCRESASELLRVLAYPKFRLNDAEREELLGDFLPFAEIVDLDDPGDPPAIPACRDPHDRVFLELAFAARADALVSGDEDLLVLKPQFDIPILSPEELRARCGCA